MEGNKDESQRCISIAEKYIANGDKEKALKFLNKAERLYPSTKARVLIERLSNINGSTAGRRKSGETDETREEHINDCSTNEKTEKTKETNNSNSTNYSQEDLDIIRRIRKAKDYYEILGLSKDATENDIKKVYKKLALKMHPDKNQAPGAKEAFQAIGNAYSVLGDVNKRKSYDIRGDEPDRFHSHHDYSRGFEADISAEELFNMFFGGAFPTGHVYSQRHSRNRHSHYHHREAQSNENGYTLLVQLAPVLMLVFLSLLGSFLVPDATFSLQQSQKYMVKRVTRHLTVPYYVKEDFRVDSQFELRRIERQVEEEYVANLRANCFKERSYKESLLWRARNSGDSNLYKKAMDLDTPSCNRLSTLV